MIAVLALTTGATACEKLVVSVIPLVNIRISPTQVTLLEGEEEDLEAELLGPEGETLTGRTVTWSTNPSSVASINGQGTLTALAQGTTTVTAEAEDLEASIPVTVLQGPTIGLSSTALQLQGPSGQDAPIEREIEVQNLGNGALDDLTRSITLENGQGANWLLASLGARSAPTTLFVQVVITDLAEGVYRGMITISDPAARNGPQDVQIEVDVGEALPMIRLTPGAVQFQAAPGTREAGTFDVAVENAGGGVVDGLDVMVTYVSGVAGGWLEATLSGMTAPTTIELAASAEFLVAGTYVADVEVSSTTAPDAILRVTFEVN